MSKGTIIFLSPKGTILELINSAAERGYRVCVIENDPSLIDGSSDCYLRHVQCISERSVIGSWLDVMAVLEVAKKWNKTSPIKAVYSALEPTLVAGAMISEFFKVPGNTVECVELIVDKLLLRTKLRESGLSKLHAISQAEYESHDNWQFGTSAAYFKPRNGFGSAYVLRCESIDDVHAANEIWARGRPSDPAWVKSYINQGKTWFLEQAHDGELLSAELLVQEGMCICLGLLSRILYSLNPIVEMGSAFPYAHPAGEEIWRMCSAIVEAVGFKNGVLHLEFIVSATRGVELVDFNPRLAGADVLQSINRAYSIKIEEIILDLLLGKPVSFSVPKTNKFCCLQYFLSPPVNLIESVTFPCDRDVTFTSLFKRIGVPVGSNDTQLDYLGCYLTEGPSFEAATTKSRLLREKIIVNKVSGGVF